MGRVSSTSRISEHQRRSLQPILTAAEALFAADVCTIVPIDPITGEPGLPIDNASRDDRPLRADGVLESVVNEGCVIVADIAERPEYENDFIRVEGIRAFAALAIGARHKPFPFAALFLDFRRSHPSTTGDDGRLRNFATESTVVLEQAWTLKRCREVIRIGEALNQPIAEPEEMFRQLEQRVRRILDTRYFFMMAVHVWQADTLSLFYRSSLPTISPPL